MFSKISIVIVMGFALVAVSCQKAPSRDGRKIGRLARAANVFGNASGTQQPAPVSSQNPGTQWGDVTSNNDQMFQQEVALFASPMLSGLPAEDQLGYLSSQRSQPTGIAFWGEGVIYGGGGGGYYGGGNCNGQIDPDRSRLHIEIFDDRTGLQRSDGSIRTQIAVHIGRDQEGFVSAQGSISNGQASVVFTDQMGSIALQGTVSGGYFSGTMSYSNSQTGGQLRTLGQFQTPTFFTCN